LFDSLDKQYTNSASKDAWSSFCELNKKLCEMGLSYLKQSQLQLAILCFEKA